MMNDHDDTTTRHKGHEGRLDTVFISLVPPRARRKPSGIFFVLVVP
jgi:hypothetical protein